jgi:hypothetical protein
MAYPGYALHHLDKVLAEVDQTMPLHQMLSVAMPPHKATAALIWKLAPGPLVPALVLLLMSAHNQTKRLLLVYTPDHLSDQCRKCKDQSPEPCSQDKNPIAPIGKGKTGGYKNGRERAKASRTVIP